MSNAFLDTVKNRRSLYAISKENILSDEKLEALIGEAILHTPSAFNSQSARVVLLLNEHHDKLWNMTEETLRKIVPAENFEPTAQKMAAFRSGYGTVLFYEDQSVIQGLQEQFPLYKDNFPLWSNHSSGMLQFVVWTALEAEGYGASLQHYNPLIDERVAQEWNVPSNWKLIAQLPFGKPTAPAGEKTFQPLEERLKVYK
ncbi:nitroreductase family protein [Paenibacillus thermoaerophilus]|uniref:Nitroreductase family protein n=1 Tax=Paenibacillus thermoaerophilus TaxID=1215385 RepID=A0ABW2V172_9BACL|nr:nitroreductase family protein [Paenibacillus thermoaerophilus]TMV18946.1 nitroreductase family protein [Paenibacillus thermoaerophilus]